VGALRLKNSANWCRVRGWITKSVKKVEIGETGRLEYADIVYQYEISDRTYTSKKIKIGGDLLSNPSKKSLTEAEALLMKYPLGKEVDVYVNPKHPKTACLERSGAEAVFLSIFCGMLAVIAGLYFTEITSLF
jgi:hypothetical protein